MRDRDDPPDNRSFAPLPKPRGWFAMPRVVGPAEARQMLADGDALLGLTGEERIHLGPKRRDQA